MELPSNPKPEKPLGHRAYGSIPHLPGSRRGPADKGLSEHQARILTEKGRDKHDTIILQEKLEPSVIAHFMGRKAPSDAAKEKLAARID